MPEEDSSMARITVRVPIEARDKIYRWAEQLGVRTGHFASMAMMLGAEEMIYRHRMLPGEACAHPGCGRPVKYGDEAHVTPQGEVIVFCAFHSFRDTSRYKNVVLDTETGEILSSRNTFGIDSD